MSDNNINNQLDEDNITNNIIVGFNEYLKTKNAETWSENLYPVIEKMKKIKDYNGIVVTMFNYYCTLYMKETSNIPQNQNYPSNKQGGRSIKNNAEQIPEGAVWAKKKLGMLLQAINNIEVEEQGNNPEIEKSVRIIVKSFKEKMMCCCQIFEMSLQLELENNLKMENNNNDELMPSISQISKRSKISKKESNSLTFLRLLTKYSINYLNLYLPDTKLRVDVTNQLQATMKLMEEEKQSMNINELELKVFSDEISKYLYVLFGNLNIIAENCLKRKKFKLYLEKVQTIKIRNEEKAISSYFEHCYKGIYDGENLTKINLTSSGCKTHYYQIDNNKDLLEAFDSYSMKPKPIKIFHFDEVIKIVIGVRTKNISNKLTSLANKAEPWLFMSLLFNSYSLDFSFSNINQAKRWFYGLKRYLSLTGREYKMLSYSGYLIRVLKLQMIQDLGLEKSKKPTFVKLLLNYNNDIEKL